MYAVFTHPPEQPWEREHWDKYQEEHLAQSKLIDKWVAVLETGTNHDNYHVNLIVRFIKDQQNTSNFRRICLKYYRDSAYVSKPTLKCLAVYNLDGLDNYLAKEPDSVLLSQWEMDYDHEAAKVRYQAVPASSPIVNKKPAITFKNYYLLQEYADANSLNIRDTFDFIDLCKRMRQDGYGMFQVLQKPGYFWAHMNCVQAEDHFEKVLINNLPLM